MDLLAYHQEIAERAQSGHLWFNSRTYMICPHVPGSTICTSCRVLQREIYDKIGDVISRCFRNDRGDDEGAFVSCRGCNSAIRRRHNSITNRLCPSCSPDESMWIRCTNCQAAALVVDDLPPELAFLSTCAHCNRRCPVCNQMHAQGHCRLDRLRNLGLFERPTTDIISRPCNIDILTHMKKGEKPNRKSTGSTSSSLIRVLPNGFSASDFAELQVFAELATHAFRLADPGTSGLVAIVATTKLHVAGPDYVIVGPNWSRHVRTLTSHARGRWLLNGAINSTSEDMFWIYVPVPTTDMTPSVLLARTIFASWLGETEPAYPVPPIPADAATPASSGTTGTTTTADAYMQAENAFGLEYRYLPPQPQVRPEGEGESPWRIRPGPSRNRPAPPPRGGSRTRRANAPLPIPEPSDARRDDIAEILQEVRERRLERDGEPGSNPE